MAWYITDRPAPAGSALTEFAITLPLYVCIITGVVFLGRVQIAKTRTAMAARYGAWRSRYGSPHPLPEDHAAADLTQVRPRLTGLLDAGAEKELSRYKDSSVLLSVFRALADTVNDTVGVQASRRVDPPSALQDTSDSGPATGLGPISLTSSCFVDARTWTITDALSLVTKVFSLEGEKSWMRSADTRTGTTSAGDQLPAIRVLESAHSPSQALLTAGRNARGQELHREPLPGHTGEMVLIGDDTTLTVIAASRELGEELPTIISITSASPGGAHQQ